MKILISKINLYKVVNKMKYKIKIVKKSNKIMNYNNSGMNN